jgi:hypothetical protein
VHIPEIKNNRTTLVDASVRASTYYLLAEEEAVPFLLAVVVVVVADDDEDEQDCTCTIGISILATKSGVMGSTLV